MKNYEYVKKSGADAQTRAYCKHLIFARDKWYAEADARAEMEGAAAVGGEWSERAREHADKLNQELEGILGKLGACVHGHKRGTPAGDLHRGCARMGTV